MNRCAKSTYSWDAEDYERHSQAQQKWARELIERLALSGAEDVLDLGCGDGKVTTKIAHLVPNGHVVGVDNSSAMIGLARKRHPSSRYPNLSFAPMDARDLSFEERFDVVFSNAALHWVKDHKPVVAGLFRSLKPGGRILLQMGGKGNAAYILAVLRKNQSYPEWQPFFDDFEFPYGFLGVEEYEAMLLAAGFIINRVELIPKDMVHQGKSGLEGWIRTTWLPYIERVPEEKREAFIGAISSHYVERVPMSTEGEVHVAMVRIEVEAEKAKN